MEKTIELDIGKIFQVLWKNIIWIIGSLLIGAIALFVVSKFIISPKYTSSVSLYVNNNSEAASGTPININDINASQKLVNTYIVILGHETVMQQVADKLMEEFADSELEEYIGLSEVNGRRVLQPAALQKVVSMQSVNNTEVLKIEAETKNAMFSARICNLIAEAAPEVLQRVIKAGSVEVIGEAKPVFVKSSPSVRNYTLIGALIGLVAAVAIVLIRYLLDNTVKGEEDIKARLNVPVLGEIPDFELNGKGGQGYGK